MELRLNVRINVPETNQEGKKKTPPSSDRGLVCSPSRGQ